MQFEPFRQLPNHENGSTPLPSLGLCYPPIPDRTGDVHFFVAIVLPKQPANLTIPQSQRREPTRDTAINPGAAEPQETYAYSLEETLSSKSLLTEIAMTEPFEEPLPVFAHTHFGRRSR
jgi:hypothetical protein